MAASVATRFAWTDDDGSGSTGTIINNAELQKIFDAIDQLFSGAGSYATLEIGGKFKVDSTAGDGLWILGGMDVSGIAAPAVSGAGKARLYFDSSVNRLKVSENGGAFKGLGSADVYAATLTNVLNTASPVNALQFTLPANAMADGDVIEISIASLEKNNKGSSGTVTAKTNVGAGSQITIGSAVTWNDDATEYANIRRLLLQRRGSGVQVRAVDPVTFATSASTNPDTGTSTPTNFTSSNTVTLEITLSAAHASFYYKPLSACVSHFKN